MKIKTGLFIAAVYILTGCSENPSESRESSAPADHTVNKDGARHKSGLSNPEANCVECHGADLRGGESGVSCYQCHGREW